MLLYPTPFLLSESFPRQLAPTVGHGVYRAAMQMVLFYFSSMFIFYSYCSYCSSQQRVTEASKKVEKRCIFTGRHADHSSMYKNQRVMDAGSGGHLARTWRNTEHKLHDGDADTWRFRSSTSS